VPEQFFTASLDMQLKYILLYLSCTYLDSILLFACSVFKGPDISILREIEQKLALNGKYIFATKLDTTLPLQAFDKAARSIRLAYFFEGKQDRDYNPIFYIKSDW
jgi:hypothetical protein